MRFLILLLALAGCAKKEIPEVVTASPNEAHAARALEITERLPGFLDRGFVVSLYEGLTMHQGDSLLFSGLALYALSCEDGKPIADGLEKMLKDLDGGAYRHPDQPDREVSLDGLLGLYRGLAKRVACGEKDRWAAVMKNHRARVAASLPAEFNLVAETLGYKLGLNAEPDMQRLHSLAVEVTTWSRLVIAGHRACYRIHLGTLALQTMEDMGYKVRDADRAEFAQVTNGIDMPTIDAFAGREALPAYLDHFTASEWQYRHQRCPKWEDPDGAGMQHPGIDYLVGFADLYGSPQ